MWIAKDWADSATPVKGKTTGSKFGIKLPAQQSKCPLIQMSFHEAKGGFA